MSLDYSEINIKYDDYLINTIVKDEEVRVEIFKLNLNDDNDKEKIDNNKLYKFFDEYKTYHCKIFLKFS